MDELETRISRLEYRLHRHEGVCEERWKTVFNKLEEFDKNLETAMSRQLQMGGALILFLAGLVVTLVF